MNKLLPTRLPRHVLLIGGAILLVTVGLTNWAAGEWDKAAIRDGQVVEVYRSA